MDLIRFLILAMTISACGFGPFKKRHDDTPTTSSTDTLNAKLLTYQTLSREVGDQYGYVHEKCDSVGFTALCKSAGGCAKADVFASEDKGRWYRSPSHDCYPTESNSSISKDMFIMLYHYLWQLGKADRTRSSEALQRIEDYGKAHNWTMGEPSNTAEGLSRVLFTPTLISLNEDMLGKLKMATPKLTSLEEVGINKGFQAHLDVLRIHLSGQVYGAINDLDLRILKAQAEREPNNALFQAVLHRYTDGDQTKATELLLDQAVFPADRLPTSNEYCTPYRFQRDSAGDDWKPCPQEGKTHAGVDFMFAAKVVIGG